MSLSGSATPGLEPRRKRRFGRPVRAGSSRSSLPLPEQERRLALISLWAVLGLFGIALILSGLTEDSIVLGLAGFGLIVLAFISSILVNHYFDAEFTSGEVVLALILLGGSALVYLLSWVFTADFSAQDRIIGAGGFGMLLAAIVIYMITRFGIRRAYYLVHERHD